ncbi:hypothetical protein RhiirA5_505315 [Rhizophagus irregularis]|uniref:Uncharacterized protein n=1 Tax=Rhizophagus irregularis TaxID=588596 RepID=A0A2N0P081_9GLOM|nr:hypothetical protein RhiirA5_505315 [Rhizophagus irregularis]
MAQRLKIHRAPYKRLPFTPPDGPLTYGQTLRGGYTSGTPTQRTAYYMAPRPGYGIPLVRWYITNDKYVNIEINNKKFIIELEKFKNKTIIWSHNEFEDISDFNVKIEEMKKELTNNASSMLDIGIICSNILVDEYSALE